MCCACHLGVNRPEHSLEDSKDTAGLTVKSKKHDLEVLLCATASVQFQSNAISYMDIAELIQKLYKDNDFKKCFLECLNTISKPVCERGFVPSPWLRRRVLGTYVLYRLFLFSSGTFFALPFENKSLRETSFEKKKKHALPG